MKKLITIILILAMILPAAAIASTCVSDVYTLFIDADMYNRLYKSGFDFDSMVFDLIVMSDGKTAYYSKQTWKNGMRTTTDVVECRITSDSSSFTLSFPDGSTLSGYYDPDQNGVWINLGGTAYFRFSSVHRYDVSEDYTKK